MASMASPDVVMASPDVVMAALDVGMAALDVGMAALDVGMAASVLGVISSKYSLGEPSSDVNEYSYGDGMRPGGVSGEDRSPDSRWLNSSCSWLIR